MKKFQSLLFTACITAAGLFAFNRLQEGSIKGTVNPAGGAVQVWAVAGTGMDTLKAPINKGAFEITGARSGTYLLIIEAKPPYRNTSKDGVVVKDGQPTDVGEIKLDK